MEIMLAAVVVIVLVAICSSTKLEHTDEPKPNVNPFLYTIGGGWGNTIQWTGGEANTVYGFKFHKPAVGDILTSPMESGRTGIFVFIEVTHPGNPQDMFFGRLSFWDYTDTPEGQALLESARKPAECLLDAIPPDLHKHIHRWGG